VARLIGYNELPSTLPKVPMAFPEEDAARSLQKSAAACMTAQGFYQAINYSFVSEAHFDMLDLSAEDPQRRVVRLLNPIAENQAVMRTLLLPGLLENCGRNVNYQQVDVRLFEIGKVFRATGGEQPDERICLAGVMSGARFPGAAQLHFGTAQVDFYDLKGAVEQLLDQLRIGDIDFAAGQAVSYAEEGQFLALRSKDGKTVGSLGKLNGATLKNFGLRQDAYYFELDLDALADRSAALPKFQPLPRFMAVRWDMAVVVADAVRGREMLDHILDLGEPLVEGAEIFDVYSGKPIAKGFKSVGITVQYRAQDQTLDDETVGAVHKRIIDSVLSTFEGRLREE